MCNKKSGDLDCSRRAIDGVSKKYWNSFVWIIWEIIINGKLKLEKITIY